jgi:hypothetical protein
MRWIATLLPWVLMAGCQAPQIRSEPIASDTYQVTRRSEFGPAIAKKQAYEHAEAHAAQQGKRMVPVAEEASMEDELRNQFEYHSLVLTYRLVDADDPARETAAEQTPAPTPLTDEDDLYTKLTKLKAMKDEGLLTDEEFQRVKEEILASP